MGARAIDPIQDVHGPFDPDMRILNPFAFAVTGGGGGGGTNFVTAINSLGALSSGFAWEIGFKATIGASDVVVTHLGRYKHAGNSEVHPLRIYTTGNALLRTVNVDMTGTPDALGMVWGALSSSIVLTAGQSFYFLSGESSSAEKWADLNTSVSTTSVATITNAAYRNSGSLGTDPAGVKSGGPVSFRYS